MHSSERLAAGLRSVVDDGIELVLAAPEAQTALRPSPDAWCVREVIGHLIDSACNNHRRFVVNQDPAVDVLIVDGYEQQAWVERQGYANVPAARLVALWGVYNRHIADVLERIPDGVLNRGRGPLANYGFSYVQKSDAQVTIGHLAEDYVAHIHHHLAQIRQLLA